jgi:hypothetical protein
VNRTPSGLFSYKARYAAGPGASAAPRAFFSRLTQRPALRCRDARALARISLGHRLLTIITHSIDHPFWGAPGRFNTHMDHPNHLALTTTAGDSRLTAVIDRTPLGAERDDRRRRSEGRATDGLALLEEELLKLRKHCRARELALARMAGAVNTLRRANRALNDDNVLLRQQVAELQGERASRRTVAQRPVLRTSGGK